MQYKCSFCLINNVFHSIIKSSINKEANNMIPQCLTMWSSYSPSAQVVWATKCFNRHAQLRFHFYDNVLVCRERGRSEREWEGRSHKLFLLRLLICMRLTCSHGFLYVCGNILLGHYAEIIICSLAKWLGWPWCTVWQLERLF